MASKGKVYISAPIAGYNLEERKKYFADMSERLMVYGYIPVNPMENGLPSSADEKAHLRKDFKMLLECDFILMCGDWRNSRGCQKESSLSLWVGIEELDKKDIGL